MSDDETLDDEILDDDDELDLDDDDLDVDDDDDLDLDDEDVDEGDEDGDGDGDSPREEREAKVADDDEDEDVDLDDEHHPDDVEEALDVVLRERTKEGSIDDYEDDDEDEPGATKRSAAKAQTFVCPSCHLVKPIHQLDADEGVCVDCT